MATVRSNNHCADLLGRCAAHDPLLLARLALAAGVAVEKLDACRTRGERLEPAEQARLAVAIERRVPTLARGARRLRSQAESSERVAEVGVSVCGSTGAPSVIRQGQGPARRFGSRAD